MRSAMRKFAIVLFMSLASTIAPAAKAGGFFGDLLSPNTFRVDTEKNAIQSGEIDIGRLEDAQCRELVELFLQLSLEIRTKYEKTVQECLDRD